ncbi:unnamed protein product [Ilex paraguariensis]|uniref:Uncharacterized protein n=1 Tax=Ilex paraguariensis TaxID=185542 RepID=A0ABC8RP38_9AQUA
MEGSNLRHPELVVVSTSGASLLDYVARGGRAFMELIPQVTRHVCTFGEEIHHLKLEANKREARLAELQFFRQLIAATTLEIG